MPDRDPREPLPDVQAQLDALSQSVAANHAAIERDHAAIERLREDAEVDRKLIAVLQDEGLIQQEHVNQLQRALQTSRTIGAAMGILMAQHKITEDQAFQALVHASQNSNRKLRDIAAYVVRTGALNEAE